MPSPSHSRTLRTKIHLAEPGLIAASDQFWNHAQLPKMFPEFLFMMHSIIRSSVRLINAAAYEAQGRANADPVCEKIAGYYATHAIEEAHHDEWLLDDLVAIGMDRVSVLARLPSPAVASLVGAQYYWVQHVHPVALFGYLAVLEGNPTPLKQLEEIQKKNGLPADSMRTMVKHARLDPHHRDEMFAQFDDLPLNESLSELVSLSAFHTIEHVTQALEDIMEESAVNIAPKKMAAALS